MIFPITFKRCLPGPLLSLTVHMEIPVRLSPAKPEYIDNNYSRIPPRSGQPSGPH